VMHWLSQGISVRTTRNIRGSLWSKLLLNCSVTTVGAIVGCTMREYVQLQLGRDVFDMTYSEALNVVLALGEQPEAMLVEPIPPSRTGSGATSQAYDGWVQQVVDNYGDTKPSMLQDLEHGRSTEIDFINGYVVGLGKQKGMAVGCNESIVAIIKAIAGGESRPSADHLSAIIARAS